MKWSCSAATMSCLDGLGAASLAARFCVHALTKPKRRTTYIVDVLGGLLSAINSAKNLDFSPAHGLDTNQN